MNTMIVHKVLTYENSKGISRVLVCFKEAANDFLGLKTSYRYGSMVLDEGITEAQAREKINEGDDVTGLIEFTPQLDENGVQTDFFRARPTA